MANTRAREAERGRLTKQAVVQRALALADADGLDALTIRRLATELGVTPMALYWHFRNKEELLAGLADRVWSELDTDVDAAEPWHRQLRGLLESLLQGAAQPSVRLPAHPGRRKAEQLHAGRVGDDAGSAAPGRLRSRPRGRDHPQRPVDRPDAGHERARLSTRS
jgi:Transcriptional regulator